jgi:hypothetical protein
LVSAELREGIGVMDLLQHGVISKIPVFIMRKPDFLFICLPGRLNSRVLYGTNGGRISEILPGVSDL